MENFDLPLIWRRGRACGSSACIEVAMADSTYFIRDSKVPGGPVLRFSSDEWDAFRAGMAAGDFSFD